MRNFTNLFSLSKTLRFELKPQGKTEKYINERGLINEDEVRAEDYCSVKGIIDEYHKYFIEKSLSELALDKDLLEEYFSLFGQKRNDDTRIGEIEKLLQKQISDYFLSQPDCKGENAKLFSKNLITELIPNYEKDANKLEVVNKFNKFTTYFKGLNKNRKNIYEGEGKKGSIAFRLISENLKRFAYNIVRFNKIKDFLCDEIELINQSYQKEINEKWGIDDISQIFQISFFNNLLTQSSIDLFNAILGAKVSETEHSQGLNQYINLYNQKNKVKLPTIDVLYKQILSEKESLSWLPDKFNSDIEALSTLEKYCEELTTNNAIQKLKDILNYISEFERDKIYVSSKNLNQLSNQALGNWSIISNLFPNNKSQSISIAEIDKAIDQYNNSLDDDAFTLSSILDYYSTLNEPFEKYFKCYDNAKQLFDNTQNSDNIFNYEENTFIVRELADSIQRIKHIAVTLLGSGKESSVDDLFYGSLIPIVDFLNVFTKIYDKLRNRISKKPYSTDKIKLNFGSPTLLDGWDKNKEPENLSVILRKDGKYFLGIMANNKNDKKSFAKNNLPNDGECYEKVVYKQISTSAGIGGFIRKCFGVTQNLGWNCPKECLNQKNKIIITDSEVNGNLKELIDCQKDFFGTYEKDGIRYQDFYNFKFKESDEYSSLTEFYTDVKQQAYKIVFQNISASYIDKLVEDGKLYLFEIYNKDFSAKSRGTKNLHTMYWEALFSEENQKELVYKLSGGAEVFYRKASIKVDKHKPTHPKNKPIKLRSDESKSKTFVYDIQKDRRYTQDKFLFHVPISINFKVNGKTNINSKVIEFIKSNGVKHVIGIDRGERNLLYASVIDLNGNIVEQFSLNEISSNIPLSDEPHIVDYHKGLVKLEKERNESRKNWGIPQKIKDLKNGYMSHVIHKLANMMVEYSAILVLENLNYGFKNSRAKVDYQVYQKFEQKLIDKLNYLVNKKAKTGELCNLYNALQLAPKIDISKVGQQCGFVFYVPAAYTSNIDPMTGFVNLFDTKYTNKDNAKAFFSKFKSIYQLPNGDYAFEVDNYSAFNSRCNDTRQNWVISSYGDRIERIKDKNTSHWQSRTINLTTEYDKLFERMDKINLKDAILAKDDAKFFNSLLYLFKLTVQLRNSDENNDYIISPIANNNGIHFDSRKCGDKYPIDADANGAYNIARKGLMLIQRYKDASADKDGKYKVEPIKFIDWLTYSQLIDK